MKKLITMLFTVGALALASCAPTVEKASNTEAKMKEKGYSVEVFSTEEAKSRIIGLNYEGASFSNALLAEKGNDADKDLLLAFYFSSGSDADNFLKKNNAENLAKMNAYLEGKLGENLTPRIGNHNNVAYVGSETSFSVAFD